MSFIQVILLIAVSALADFSMGLISRVMSMPEFSNLVGNYINIVQMIPWNVIIFAAGYGIISYFFANSRGINQISGDDLIGYIFMCPLISVIINYGGGLLGPIIGNFFINPFYIFSFITAYFTAYFSEFALKYNLQFHGLFIVGFLGPLIYIADPFIQKTIHFSISPFWYTIIGAAIALIAFFQDEDDGDGMDREHIATINRLRKLY